MKEEATSGLEITGFGDVFNNVREGMQGELNQIEVDLATGVAGNIGIEAAIAFDGEAFGLGAFVVDFSLLDGKKESARSIPGIDIAGIAVGLFDIPFGIDYNVYPSIDRKLVSGPLAVEHIHDYWNDMGIQAYAENGWMNSVVFATNGFAWS